MLFLVLVHAGRPLWAPYLIPSIHTFLSHPGCIPQAHCPSAPPLTVLCQGSPGLWPSTHTRLSRLFLYLGSNAPKGPQDPTLATLQVCPGWQSFFSKHTIRPFAFSEQILGGDVHCPQEHSPALARHTAIPHAPRWAVCRSGEAVPFMTWELCPHAAHPGQPRLPAQACTNARLLPQLPAALLAPRGCFSTSLQE